MNAPDFEQLTLFREDSPASPSVWLESKKEKKMTVTYGLKCSELSENLRRVGSLVRTYLESSRLPEGEWRKTWKKQAITSSCSILKLRLSERRTEGLELRLWPTPAARDYKGSNSEESIKKSLEAGKNGFLGQLPNAVKMWPTPSASDCGRTSINPILTKNGTIRHQNKQGGQSYARLDAVAAMYPTPTARCSQTPCEHGDGAPDLATKIGGQLNPTWVEWLMGFPIGWTDLSASETP